MIVYDSSTSITEMFQLLCPNEEQLALRRFAHVLVLNPRGLLFEVYFAPRRPVTASSHLAKDAALMKSRRFSFSFQVDRQL
jgi:hypothetical protein